MSREMSRRDFLKSTALIGTGLIIGKSLNVLAQGVTQTPTPIENLDAYGNLKLPDAAVEKIALAPKTVLTFNNESVGNSIIAKYVDKNGQIYGVDAKGNIVNGLFPQADEVENSGNVFTKQNEASIDGPVPFSVWTSNLLTKKDTAVAIPNNNNPDDVIHTVAGVRFHKTKDTDLRDGWSTDYNSGPLAPEFNGKVPQDGAEMIETALNAVIKKASKDNGQTVVLSKDVVWKPEQNINNVWTVKNGVSVLLARNPSQDQMVQFAKVDVLKVFGGDPRIYVDQNTGALTIVIFTHIPSSAAIVENLEECLNLVLYKHDPNVAIKKDFLGVISKKYAPWLTNLFFPPNGIDKSFTWALDVGISKQDITGTGSDNITWVVNAN